jgi:hypothetical protein
MCFGVRAAVFWFVSCGVVIVVWCFSQDGVEQLSCVVGTLPPKTQDNCWSPSRLKHQTTRMITQDIKSENYSPDKEKMMVSFSMCCADLTGSPILVDFNSLSIFQFDPSIRYVYSVCVFGMCIRYVYSVCVFAYWFILDKSSDDTWVNHPPSFSIIVILVLHNNNNNNKHAYAGIQWLFYTSKSPIGTPGTAALRPSLTSVVEGWGCPPSEMTCGVTGRLPTSPGPLSMTCGGGGAGDEQDEVLRGGFKHSSGEASDQTPGIHKRSAAPLVGVHKRTRSMMRRSNLSSTTARLNGTVQVGSHHNYYQTYLLIYD